MPPTKKVFSSKLAYSALILIFTLVTFGPLLVNVFSAGKIEENQPWEACVPIAGSQPGEFKISIVVRGVARHFKVALPAPYGGDTPRPAVFFFHGQGGTIDDFKAEGPYTTSRRNDAIVIAPLGQTVHGGFGWDEACGGADMSFFDGIMACVSRRFAVDRSKISAVGFSWGGDFVNALGCCRGKGLRSIATISAGEMGTRDGYKTDLSLCQSPAPRLMSVRDVQDPVYKAEAFAKVMNNYRQLLKCSNVAPSEAGGCKLMTGCSRDLVECPIPGMGHTITRDAAERATNFVLKD